MPPSPDDAVRFQFSTEAFPQRVRLTAWREVFGRTVCNLDITPLQGEDFHSQATVCQLPGLGVLLASSDAAHLSHTRELIRDGDLWFMAAPTCSFTATQLGRSVEGGPGDGVLMTNAEVGSITLAAASHFTTFRVPTEAIAALVPDVWAAVARNVPATNAALQLLIGYLAIALNTDAPMTPELQRSTVTHVYDLLALALGATRDAAEIAKSRGARAARLGTIKADMAARFWQHGLTIGAVARRHGISPVYIRKMFAQEGTSFAEFLLARRLEHAHRILSDPAFADRAITAVAAEAGFGDLSYFNRAFRRRYGVSPSDLRAASRNKRGS